MDNKILHFGIRVSNIQNSIKWYESNLGFKTIKQSDKPELLVKLAQLELSNSFIELIQPYNLNKKAQNKKSKSLIDALRDSPSHLAISVEDLLPIYNQFKKENIELVSEGSLTSFFCYDLDYNLIEIKQR